MQFVRPSLNPNPNLTCSPSPDPYPYTDPDSWHHPSPSPKLTIFIVKCRFCIVILQITWFWCFNFKIWKVILFLRKILKREELVKTVVIKGEVGLLKVMTEVRSKNPNFGKHHLWTIPDSSFQNKVAKLVFGA